jgi:ABC-type multidrug transport system ATPase subunit
MIELDRAEARVPPVALAPLSVTLGAGCHALLGGRADGASIVLGVLAATVRLRRGHARVLGEAAGADQVRRKVAHLSLEAPLPEPLRVGETLTMAASIRGEPQRDPRARLDAFGLAALADRRCGTLSREERRAVALAEALTSDARVLLVEEPFATVDARALGAVAEHARARAHAGACVVFATASPRDARALADDVLTFDGGALLRKAPAADPVAFAGPRGARVRIITGDARTLAAGLAEEPAVKDVLVERGVVVVRGEDLVSLATAVARVSVREGVAIDAMTPELLRGDELRAAIAGDVAGAYRAAYERARQAAPQTVGRPEGFA